MCVMVISGSCSYAHMCVMVISGSCSYAHMCVMVISGSCSYAHVCYGHKWVMFIRSCVLHEFISQAKFISVIMINSNNATLWK